MITREDTAVYTVRDLKENPSLEFLWEDIVCSRRNVCRRWYIIWNIDKDNFLDAQAPFEKLKKSHWKQGETT